MSIVGRPALAAAWAASLLLAFAPVAFQEDPLNDPSRPDDERERDAGTRPLEIYEWMGVAPGMTVVDILPAAGYNTHLLARVVGPEGKVVAAYTSDDGKAALEARFAEAGLGQVEVVLGLSAVPDGSVDRHVTVRNIHDLFIPAIAERFGLDTEGILAEVHRTLADDGYLCVVDARTTAEGVDDQTHRINEEMVIRELTARGFELAERSDLLADPDDDNTQSGFPTRWHVDRMLLKFRKAPR